MNITLSLNAAFVIDENINIIDCISFFDAGHETIYILNSRHKFNGLVIRKGTFKSIWTDNDNNSWISTLKPSEFIKDPVDDADLQEKLAQIIKDGGIGEIPIILQNRIVNIARTGKNEALKVNWDVLEEAVCRNYLNPLSPICLSSLADENLRNFYNKFRSCLDIVVLNEKNLDNYLNNEFPLLIYGSDIFPEKDNMIQMNYHDLYQTLAKKTYDRLRSRIQINGSWAALHEDQCNPVEYIKCFDQGYDSINIIDDEDHFKALLCKHNFREDFPGKNYRRWSNLYLEERATPEETLDGLAAMFFGTARQEIPIIRDQKIVASGKHDYIELREDYIEGPLKLKIYWEYIDGTLILKYLKNKKVLISSEFEDIKGFYDLYKSSLDLTVLDKDSLLEYLSGAYDILIFGSDIWPNMNQTKKINAQVLYFKLLNETIANFLQNNSIRYYEFQILSPMNNQIRWSKEPYHLYFVSNGVVWKKNYYVLADEQNQDGGIVNGSRITANLPSSWKHCLYFFGPCLTTGLCHSNDCDTIGSMLQEKLNLSCPETYRVINMGVIGGLIKSNINNLYRMLDTGFKPGDIVINYSNVPVTDLLPLPDYVYDIAIPFRRYPDINCFIEGVAPHLDKEGNEVFAEYIFDILFPSLQIAEHETELKNCRFLDSFALENEVPDGLVSYLKDLRKLQFRNTKGKKIGSIVMNCNPFTKGHQYLIEKSLEQADYLYIFVVEEDKSYFKFNDRFNMVKLFCDRYSRIKVIPSGQYIISSITFAEYFNKDSLQDVSIDPTFDATIFAEHIAPALNIKYRFVGEEPFDAVTAQYNLALKDVLPNYMIDLIEIPRCTVNDEIISASSVRRFMKEKNIEKLHQYLPDTTFNYLADHNYF